jgi:hypothetical protein
MRDRFPQRVMLLWMDAMMKTMKKYLHHHR